MYIDFMGTDAAIFRTLGKQTAMRTDQYNSRWLNGERGSVGAFPALCRPGWYGPEPGLCGEGVVIALLTPAHLQTRPSSTRSSSPTAPSTTTTSSTSSSASGRRRRRRAQPCTRASGASAW